jgi:hypothetical protein
MLTTINSALRLHQSLKFKERCGDQAIWLQKDCLVYKSLLEINLGTTLPAKHCDFSYIVYQ